MHTHTCTHSCTSFQSLQTGSLVQHGCMMQQQVFSWKFWAPDAPTSGRWLIKTLLCCPPLPPRPRLDCSTELQVSQPAGGPAGLSSGWSSDPAGDWSWRGGEPSADCPACGALADPPARPDDEPVRCSHVELWHSCGMMGSRFDSLHFVKQKKPLSRLSLCQQMLC